MNDSEIKWPTPEQIAEFERQQKETEKNYEVLRQVYEVTEWKDGAVYKTVSRGYKWVGMDEKAPEGFLWVSMPTGYSGKTIRKRGKK